MKKYILYIILGAILIVGFTFVSNSKLNKSPNSKEEPRGMIDQDNQHGGGHTTSTAKSQRSYTMDITRETPNKVPSQPVNFTYTIKNDRGEVLKDFETVHEKKMHFIVVREDLQHFQHLHPKFDESSGEWIVDVTFPTDGPYRLFPDFTPAKSADNQKLLPVTVNSRVEVGDKSKYKAQTLQPDKGSQKTVGDYQVVYKIPSVIKSQQSVSYGMDVIQDGHPVANLEKYLGALGHSVILKEGSLDFIHTHAEEAMDDSKMNEIGNQSAQINFATTFPEAGRYKIFTQFQHQGKVITTDYIVNVK